MPERLYRQFACEMAEDVTPPGAGIALAALAGLAFWAAVLIAVL